MSTSAPPPAPLSPLSPVESAKRQAAYIAVDTHFPRPSPLPTTPLLIGIGSGSTVIYVVERILQLPSSLLSQCIFIPTGYQSRELILSGSLPLGDIDLHNHLHIAFDGADEVDPTLNCIKGGGACLFQEKLVAVKADKFVVVADFRKISSSLSMAYAAGVPIEVVPQVVSWVAKRLLELGAVNPKLRMGGMAKAGPCVTDNGNFIIDAPFHDGCVLGKQGEGEGEVVNGKGAKGCGVGDTRTVERLAEEIKKIVGVVEHGIFCKGNAKAVVAYFGMEDGTVTTRAEEA
ncbi:ribose 5-phosphate isomerase [Terfezia boudieri ATCC MYA-4762]|uniref:Ribose-5-phosphate isomerase n=1 Tax=Terfezia boudieri ATCC MYA-4762 TaxID=1051890 RepID=A0A3N4LR23_9PEZI|nr:ribose 5-phosphate isomerase [Terfezia boudieri ATCC MYA-4762]